MFENAFKTELARFDVNQMLIEVLWGEVRTRYSKKSRHYHNLIHLDHLCTELSAIRELLDDWSIIVFSIAYHDIVYNTLKKDNEEKSAAFAVERLTLVNLPAHIVDQCRNQILATKGHGISTDSDTNYFMDADLAILGANPDSYQTYSKQVRKEYKYYPGIVYKNGRKKVLQDFLRMDAIYKTTYFASRYEQQARKNIQSEITELG